MPDHLIERMRTAARLLSVLLHPVWMPTLTLVLAFTVDPHLAFAFTPEGRLIIYAMMFVMTALFPLASTWMMVRSGLLGSLSMPDRRERILPFLLALIYYAMAYYLLRRTPNHPATWAMAFGTFIALLLTLLITLRWKISAHMVGLGGALGALLALMWLHGVHVPLVLSALFVLAGLLGTVRLFLTDHSPGQVYAGALVGAACTFACTAAGLYY